MRRVAWWMGWLLAGCYDGGPPVDEAAAPVIFEVPAGASASGLGATLEAQGLVSSELAWKWMLRWADGSCLKAGRFKVSAAMTPAELMQTLCGVPIPEDEPFIIQEGWRIRDIDAALAAKGWIAPGAYQAVAEGKTVQAPFEVSGPTYEGYLFPETYRVVPEGFQPERLVARQLDTFKARFVDAHPEGFGDRTLHEVVIMASMLEREEPKVSQRPVVAGILWKRIDNNWKLGVDATSRYVLDDWNHRGTFLKQLRDPSDPYNTRLLAGLPPTAIGNPSLESLEASLAPEDSPYWYYLHDANGVFHGGRDGAEHSANRRKYNVY